MITTLVLDGDYFMHRVLHSPKMASMRTSTGEYSGILFGVLKTLKTALTAFEGVRFQRVVFLVGGGDSVYRQSLYPDYKKKSDKERQKWEDIDPALGASKKDVYKTSKEVVCDVLQHFGVRVLRKEGYEADDLAFLAVNQLASLGEHCILYTEDQDLLQLASATTSVALASKGLVVTPENFTAHVNWPHKATVCYLSMVGGHDNIKNPVKGFGEKAVLEMIAELSLDEDYSEDAVVAWGKRVGGRKPSLLTTEEADKSIRLNYNLVDISRVPFTKEDKVYVWQGMMQPHQANPSRIQEVLQRFEYKSLSFDNDYNILNLR